VGGDPSARYQFFDLSLIPTKLPGKFVNGIPFVGHGGIYGGGRRAGDAGEETSGADP